MRINSAVGKEGMVIILSGILRVRHLLKPSLDLQEIRVSYITLQAGHHNLCFAALRCNATYTNFLAGLN